MINKKYSSTSFVFYLGLELIIFIISLHCGCVNILFSLNVTAFKFISYLDENTDLNPLLLLQ